MWLYIILYCFMESVLLLSVVREELRELSNKSEEDLKSLQIGVGEIVGEVLRQLTDKKCK